MFSNFQVYQNELQQFGCQYYPLLLTKIYLQISQKLQIYSSQSVRFEYSRFQHWLDSAGLSNVYQENSFDKGPLCQKQTRPTANSPMLAEGCSLINMQMLFCVQRGAAIIFILKSAPGLRSWCYSNLLNLSITMSQTNLSCPIYFTPGVHSAQNMAFSYEFDIKGKNYKRLQEDIVVIR